MATTAALSGRNAFVIPAVTVQPAQELLLVRPNQPLGEAETHAAIVSMVSALRGLPKGQLETVTHVANLLCMAVPDLAPSLVSIRSLRVKVVTMTSDDYKLWLHIDDPADGVDRPVGYPLPVAPLADAFAVTDVASVYASVASIIFAIGRQASESSKVASLDKRPDALIRRFNISEANQVILPGRAAGPSREHLEAVYNAFANYSEVRSVVTAHFIGVKRSASHFPIHMEVLMTNFNLMRGAGMTHVDAILRLAKMHPWTLRIPQLEPYWSKFVNELASFNQVAEDARPYHRLLVGQGDFHFISAEYRPLIAVAGDFIKDVEATFSGYVYNRDKYTTLIDEVRSYAPHYTQTVGVNNLANMLKVPDVPLPTRPSLSTTASAAIV